VTLSCSMYGTEQLLSISALPFATSS